LKNTPWSWKLAETRIEKNQPISFNVNLVSTYKVTGIMKDKYPLSKFSLVLQYYFIIFVNMQSIHLNSLRTLIHICINNVSVAANQGQEVLKIGAPIKSTMIDSPEIGH
jgi:hypothetical protein